MKTKMTISVLALTAMLASTVTYADDKGVVANVTGAVKKTAVALKEKVKMTEADAPSGDAADDNDVTTPKKMVDAPKKMVETKSTEDDSKDAEGNRTVSDTSITIFSQNAYIQSIMQKTTHIKSARLKELMARGDKATMLDVRPRSEFAKTPGIKGVTLNIPRNFLEVEAYEKLPNKDASIIIISTKGIRGGLAANTLQNMGYTNVRNLMDGLQGWNKAK